jgi:hypothetical protein
MAKTPERLAKDVEDEAKKAIQALDQRNYDGAGRHLRKVVSDAAALKKALKAGSDRSPPGRKKPKPTLAEQIFEQIWADRSGQDMGDISLINEATSRALDTLADYHASLDVGRQVLQLWNSRKAEQTDDDE